MSDNNVMSDLEIAQRATMRPIGDIAAGVCFARGRGVRRQRDQCAEDAIGLRRGIIDTLVGLVGVACLYARAALETSQWSCALEVGGVGETVHGLQRIVRRGEIAGLGRGERRRRL